MDSRERTPARQERDASAFQAGTLEASVCSRDPSTTTPPLGTFLLWATAARTLLWVLPVGLFFAAATDPATASRSVGMASAITLGSGLALWPTGRLLDHVGRWRGLRGSLLAGAGTLGLLGAAAATGAPAPLLFTGGVVAGAALSPLIATPRALLAGLVEPARLSWASGLEATSLEVALILAPLLAAAVGGAGAPAMLIAAGGGLAVIWLGFPRGQDLSRTRTRRSAPLLDRRVVQLALLTALLGVGGGLLEPGLAALPVQVGDWTVSSALLFVAIGVGSGAGGVLAARSGWPHRSVHAVPLFALHAAALVAAVGVDGPWRLAAMVVAGLPIAPLTSLAGLHLDRWIEPARLAETFGLVTSVHQVATGAGQAVAARLAGVVEAAHLVALAALPAAVAAVTVTAATLTRRWSLR